MIYGPLLHLQSQQHSIWLWLLLPSSHPLWTNLLLPLPVFKDLCDYIGFTRISQYNLPIESCLQSPLYHVRWHSHRFWGSGCGHLWEPILQPTTPHTNLCKPLLPEHRLTAPGRWLKTQGHWRLTRHFTHLPTWTTILSIQRGTGRLAQAIALLAKFSTPFLRGDTQKELKTERNVIPELRETLLFRLSNSTPQCQETERAKEVLVFCQSSRVFSPMGHWGTGAQTPTSEVQMQMA